MLSGTLLIINELKDKYANNTLTKLDNTNETMAILSGYFTELKNAKIRNAGQLTAGGWVLPAMVIIPSFS